LNAQQQMICQKLPQSAWLRMKKNWRWWKQTVRKCVCSVINAMMQRFAGGA